MILIGKGYILYNKNEIYIFIFNISKKGLHNYERIKDENKYNSKYLYEKLKNNINNLTIISNKKINKKEIIKDNILWIYMENKKIKKLIIEDKKKYYIK